MLKSMQQNRDNTAFSKGTFLVIKNFGEHTVEIK